MPSCHPTWMRCLRFGLAALILLTALAPATAGAAGHDSRPWATGPATDADLINGFNVTDNNGIPFLRTYHDLGLDVVGLPISRRFVWNGFTVQAFQKAILQWQPAISQVAFLNILDVMHDRGLDGWLQTVRATPPPLPSSFDAGLTDFNQIAALRLTLLDENPTIKAKYEEAPNPLLQYGLPTSRVVDNGSHFVMRFQRVVMQVWKVEVPWAAVGQVTIANGGDIAKEAGLLPASALRPDQGAEVERAVNFAVARFERGHMIWREDTAEIYVLDDPGTYSVYPDTWTPDQPEQAVLRPPAPYLEPIRGFGKVWREQPGVRERLGWQAAPEQGVRGTVREADGVVTLDTRGLGLWILEENGRFRKPR